MISTDINLSASEHVLGMLGLSLCFPYAKKLFGEGKFSKKYARKNASSEAVFPSVNKNHF